MAEEARGWREEASNTICPGAGDAVRGRDDDGAPDATANALPEPGSSEPGLGGFWGLDSSMTACKFDPQPCNNSVHQRNIGAINL